jgi:hypothetical protein
VGRTVDCFARTKNCAKDAAPGETCISARANDFSGVNFAHAIRIYCSEIYSPIVLHVFPIEALAPKTTTLGFLHID